MTMLDEPYSYQERVLLEPLDESNWNIRLESHASWKVDTLVHPFSQRVSTLLELFPNVVRVLLQTASAPSRYIPSSALDHVSTLQAHPSFPPSHLGPSGVWIQVHVRANASDSVNDNNDQVVSKLMLELVERRLITAPLGLSTTTKLDKYIQKLEVTRLDNSYTSPQTFQVYQLFLPTNGAGWSADALEQSLTSLSTAGCSLMNNATALSSALLGISSSSTTNIRRSVWSEFTSMFGTQTFSQGVQYALPKKTKASYASWIVPGTRIAPCPLADTSTEVFLVHWNGTAESLTLESLSSNMDTTAATSPPPHYKYQVAKTTKRSQGMAYTGRFETTIVNHVDDCRAHVHFRDVLPAFTRPIWQSLQVQVLQGTRSGDDLPGTMPPSTSSSVEWSDEDGSAVLTVFAYLEPLASLQISLDYQPAFLSFQEFPGDPNRGFETSPAVVTMTCSDVPTTLYSNTLLILPPVPDMSMPFNVISLTCSLYAYVFGSILAFLVKKSSDKIRHALHPEEKPKNRLVRLKEKIKSKFQKKEQPKAETAPTEATPPVESHEKAE
jgi:hypothetical protein